MRLETTFRTLLLLALVTTSSGCSLFSSRRAGPDRDRPRGDDDWAMLPGSRVDDTPSYAAPGLYVGGKLAVGQLLGDFDGDLAIVDDQMAPTEFNFVPDVDASPGVGIEISNRWRYWELGLGYTLMEYDGEFLGGDMDMDAQHLDLTVRRYYWIDQALQPYLLGGFGMSQAQVENGALDPLGVSEGELKSGINYNFGIGVALYTTPWVSWWGQAMWRFGRYEEVEARFGTRLPEKWIDSDGWELSAGVSFRVLAPRD